MLAGFREAREQAVGGWARAAALRREQLEDQRTLRAGRCRTRLALGGRAGEETDEEGGGSHGKSYAAHVRRLRHRAAHEYLLRQRRDLVARRTCARSPRKH